MVGILHPSTATNGSKFKDPILQIPHAYKWKTLLETDIIRLTYTDCTMSLVARGDVFFTLVGWESLLGVTVHEEYLIMQ